MSRYVRSRGTTGLPGSWQECYTCGTRAPWKKFHCGHHFHGKLDYDERNLRPQCVRCNYNLHGNLGIYAQRLIEENGIEWYKQLRRDANKIIKYDAIMLNKIIKDLEEKLNERHL